MRLYDPHMLPSILLLAAILLPAASTRTDALAKLGGDWTVDLRPTSEAPAHPMPMTLKIADNGEATGMFYRGPIEAGLASDNKGSQCLAFTTSDPTGPYHTSGCLDAAGHIEGQTWSEGRKFLMHWIATRKVDEGK